MLIKIFNSGMIISILLLSGCSGNQLLARETPPDGTKVVVIEFSDFNCPACKSASVLAQKIKAIPNLYFEFRHFPLPILGHESSAAAANAFECAREQIFEAEMENALFENQGRLNKEFFVKIPELYNFTGNFNAGEFEKCISENRYEGLVKNDTRTAISSGINATPTFLVNGVKTPRSNLLEAIANEFKKVD